MHVPKAYISGVPHPVTQVIPQIQGWKQNHRAAKSCHTLPYMRRGLSSTRESNIRRRERQHHRRRRQRNAEECPQQQCSTHVLERRDTLRHGDAGYLSDREPDMEAVDAGLVCQFKLCGSEFAEVHLLERHVEHVHTCRICRRMTPELKHTVTPMCQRCVDEGTSPTWARLRGHSLECAKWDGSHF